MRPGLRAFALGLVLTAVVAVVFGPALGHDFVDHEDGRTVVANDHLDAPLDLEWFRHVLLDVHPSGWVPLTWTSYRIDAGLHGIEARGFVLSQLLFHLGATLLVFLVWGRFTGRWLVASAAAWLFAVHPQRVEAVIWVSARAEVLATLLAASAVHLHLNVRRGPWQEAGLVLVCALGVSSHPAFVVLPFGLLLLDRWPLRRLEDRRAALDRIVEKLPLFGVCVAAVMVAARARATLTEGIGSASWLERVERGIVAIAATSADVVWPAGLHPAVLRGDGPTSTVVLVSAAGLALLVGFAVRAWRARPWWSVGIGWFLLFLLPSVVASEGTILARADRWTAIGWTVLSVGIAFGVADALRGRRARASGAAVAIVLAALTLHSARAQVAVWQDTSSLFGHVLALDPGNAHAHHRLAVVARNRNDFHRAERHYLRVLDAWPGHAQVQGELADVFRAQGRVEAADALHENAGRTGFDDAFADGRLGVQWVRIGEDDRAIALLEAALDRDPASGDLRAALALAMARKGRVGDARRHRDAALRSAPVSVDGLVLLAWLLATAPEGELRDGALALEVLARIPTGEFERRADALEARAAALALAGDAAGAFGEARRAADRAEARGHVRRANDARERSLLYLQGESWFETRHRDDR